MMIWSVISTLVLSIYLAGHFFIKENSREITFCIPHVSHLSNSGGTDYQTLSIREMVRMWFTKCDLLGITLSLVHITYNVFKRDLSRESGV